MFLIYHVTSSHHFAKFSSHRSFGSSDTAAKIFHVTLQYQVIKVFDVFIGDDFLS